MVLIVLRGIKRLIATKELLFQSRSHAAMCSVVCTANGRDRETERVIVLNDALNC
jgi:hypothetical protein